MTTIATMNANSIRVRLDQILAFLAVHQPDVLAIQETKVQDEDFPVSPISEAGYHVVYRGQRSHAGVALITRVRASNVTCGLQDGDEPDEARLIRADVGDLALVNTYIPQGREIRSPHFTYKLNWFRRLRAFFERHFTPQTPLIWLGDINVAPEPIDVYAPKRLVRHVDFAPEARQAFRQVSDWGFVDVFRLLHPGEEGHYTYWDYRVRNSLERNMGWRIDHILATEDLAGRCTRAWIDRKARSADRPSDHTFLVAEFDLSQMG